MRATIPLCDKFSIQYDPLNDQYQPIAICRHGVPIELLNNATPNWVVALVSDFIEKSKKNVRTANNSTRDDTYSAPLPQKTSEFREQLILIAFKEVMKCADIRNVRNPHIYQVVADIADAVISRMKESDNG